MHIAADTSVAEQMLSARMANTRVLPEGAVVPSDVMDLRSVSMMKALALI